MDDIIEQAQWIKEFCDKEGFQFIQLPRVPCSLYRGYVDDDKTIFISGFHKGSKRVSISRGGLKSDLTLKVPVEKLSFGSVHKHMIPKKFICDKCKKKSFNLRTQDDHKTYDCSACHK